MKLRLLSASLSFAALMGGCVSLQSVSLTQIPKERNRPISAEVSKLYFFGFNFDNNYADDAARILSEKCAGGQVKGILTKDENINYFIGIVMKRQITAHGYCLKGEGA